MALMKLREYARHRGVSHVAVMKAISSGRLNDALKKDDRGLPLIDPDVAAVEWLPGEQELLKDITPKPNASDDDDEEAADGLSDDISLRKKMARSRAIKERYAARLAKLEYKERSGLLVEVESVKKEWTQVASIVRTKVMGIPSKARQRIPELSQEQIAVLQAIVSSTLEDLADGDD